MNCIVCIDALQCQALQVCRKRFERLQALKSFLHDRNWYACQSVYASIEVNSLADTAVEEVLSCVSIVDKQHIKEEHSTLFVFPVAEIELTNKHLKYTNVLK